MVFDTLPAGMTPVSATPTYDSMIENFDGSWSVAWNNVGPLTASGGSTVISFIAHIDDDAVGTMTNLVEVTGYPPTGNPITDDDEAYVTATPANINVVKTASPTIGAASTDVTFTITVTNTGQVVLNPIIVVDTLPLGMSPVSATLPYDSTVDNGDGTWTVTWNNVGPLAASGGFTTIAFVAHIDTDATGTMINHVDVTGTPPTGDPVTDDDNEPVTATPANIEVIKTANPTSYLPLTDITFTITVTNTGEAVLDPIIVEDTLPDGMSPVSAVPPYDSAVDNGDGSWSVTWNNVGPLAPGGGSTVISFIAHADSDASGTMTNWVDATGHPPTGDPVTGDDSADIGFLGDPCIEVTKTANPTTAQVGDTITYTICVSNCGDVGLEHITVVDSILGDLSGSFADTLGVGEFECHDFTYVVDINDFDPLINCVNVHSDPEGPLSDDVSDSDCAIVELIKPCIVVMKEVWDPESEIWVDTIKAPVGTSPLFRITINNCGEIILHNIVATDELSSHLEYRNNANPPEDYVSPDLREIIWNFNELLPGENIEITYQAETIHICGGYNIITVTTSEGVSDLDITTVKVLEFGNPTLDITKQVWDNAGGSWVDYIAKGPGKNLEFRITITNNANTKLTDIYVTDTFPLQLEYDNNANKYPYSQSDNEVIWQYTTINSGETKEITYNAITRGAGGGDNQASIWIMF